MKILLITILSLLSASSFGQAIDLSIEDISKKVSEQNYLVLQNAERVYQKKENIKFARASLLPKLNVWNLLKIPAIIVNPIGVVDIIQDVAPFLIPANWFKLDQAKSLYAVQEKQYTALWANQVNTAKLLYLSVYREKMFYELIQNKSTQYKEILEIARSRNIFGQGNVFSYNLIKDRFLALEEDLRNLDNLVYSETKDLQYIAGINNELDVELQKPTLPDLTKAKPIDFGKIIFKVLDASPEIMQYQYLFSALDEVKKQIDFNILGTSTFSLGEGNGAFDHIPIQDGLGFGNGASVRITKSEGRILKLQLNATVETLKRQVNVLVKEYNSLINNYELTSERRSLAEANYNSMADHLAVGGVIDALEMIEILDNLYTSKILILSYQYRFSDLVEKLKRMTFSEDYSKGPIIDLGGRDDK